jgi:hypothetical protein
MIFVELAGGLGNQLFQYATGRSVATRLGVDLCLDLTQLYARTRGVTPRQFELHRYMIKACTSEGVRGCLWGARRRIGLAARYLNGRRIKKENGSGFDASVFDAPDGALLVGYWQSYRYFDGIRDTLSDELLPRLGLSADNVAVRDCMRSCASVAVHVRRGDYVTNKGASGLHGALDFAYYSSALEWIRCRVRNPVFFVFSDEVGFARKEFGGVRGEIVYVEQSHEGDAWQDLELMASAMHSIIANSSFSWWGAWMADQRRTHETRYVVAPRNWFRARPGASLADRLLPQWSVM